MNDEKIKFAIGFFEERNMYGVVRLITFLASPAGSGIKKIGSTTIGMKRHDLSKYNSEDERAMFVFSLPSAHFGTTNSEIRAIDDVIATADIRLDELPQDKRTFFDEFCSDLHLAAQNRTGEFVLVGSAMVLYDQKAASVQ